MRLQQGVARTGRNNTGPPCSVTMELYFIWRRHDVIAWPVRVKPPCYRRRQTPESKTILPVITVLTAETLESVDKIEKVQLSAYDEICFEKYAACRPCLCNEGSARLPQCVATRSNLLAVM